MSNVLAQASALRGLLDAPRESCSPQVLVQAVLSCSDELVFAGEALTALQLLDRANGLGPGLPSEWTARLDAMRARALLAAGRFAQSLELAQGLLSGGSGLWSKAPDALLELRLIEGSCLWLLSRPDESIEKLTGLRNSLLAGPDSPQLARCTTQLSAALWARGDIRDARRLALDAVISARRCAHHYSEAQALANYGFLQRSSCRWAEATESCEEALRVHEDLGNRFASNNARRDLALIHFKRGWLDSASTLCEQCVVESGQLGQEDLHAHARLLKGLILLHRGARSQAQDEFRGAPAVDVHHANTRIALLSIEFQGDVALELLQVRESLDQYTIAWHQALALVPKGDIVAELRRRRAECYYLLGRHAEAYEEAKSGLEHCRELGDRYEEAATYRVLALSAGAVGRPDEAKQWFDQGFAYYDDIETPYEWGKLWMAYGDWLLSAHAGDHADRRGALEAYYAARDHFERMGAEAKLAEANERLARLSGPAVEVVSDSERAEARRTPRRPRRATELERKSAWALETFGLVTRRKSLLALLDDVSKLAQSDTPILILGESGTGKELIAAGIHRLSGRTGNFMAINAGALPREIIESELFGHVAGAFTGATRDKQGMVEVCDHGTVFLDEIAEMSVELQSRLLRFLETGEFRRVGSTRNIGVNTRVVAATNRERAALEGGDEFRRDLFYRLAHAVVTMPPLRHRGDDVELLVDHFLEDACRAHKKQVRLAPATRQRLAAYSWPGNIRQLKSEVRRLVILTGDGQVAGPEMLRLEESEVEVGTLSEELGKAEKRRMIEALAQSRGSVSEAAKTLGLPRTTLINRIKRYGLKK